MCFSFDMPNKALSTKSYHRHVPARPYRAGHRLQVTAFHVLDTHRAERKHSYTIAWVIRVDVSLGRLKMSTQIKRQLIAMSELVLLLNSKLTMSQVQF